MGSNYYIVTFRFWNQTNSCMFYAFFKSNLPYFNTSDRDLTFFEADPFIYFTMLVAMDRGFAYLWILDNSITFIL